MALTAPRSDLYAPCISKTFTTFSAVQTLHVEPTKLSTGAAPAGINHLPSSIFVKAAAADVLEFTDALGVTNTLTFVRAFDGTLPFTCAALTANTTVDSVTASWNPEP